VPAAERGNTVAAALFRAVGFRYHPGTFRDDNFDTMLDVQ
jgi:hypothetical protein